MVMGRRVVALKMRTFPAFVAHATLRSRATRRSTSPRSAQKGSVPRDRVRRALRARTEQRTTDTHALVTMLTLGHRM